MAVLAGHNWSDRDTIQRVRFGDLWIKTQVEAPEEIGLIFQIPT